MSADTLSDPLHLRVSDGAEADTAVVVLQTPNPVASERPPESAPFRVHVYPNPTPGPLALRIESDGPWSGEAVVLDVLGRTRGRLGVGSGAPVAVDVGGLPAGTYFVRVASDGGGAVTERFVVSD